MIFTRLNQVYKTFFATENRVHGIQLPFPCVSCFRGNLIYESNQANNRFFATENRIHGI